MKLTSSKTKKVVKVLSVVAVMAVMFTVCAFGASAAGNGGGGGAADANAVNTYETVIDFILVWIRRLGAAVGLIGAIMFGLAIKNDDPDRKTQGLTTMISGFCVTAIAAAADIFNLFT